ncbi:DNA-directed RNA polymerase II [Cryptosporidium felis]|nr:DNA-directed RNA polymerase II [Cryptosporidium felis]
MGKFFTVNKPDVDLLDTPVGSEKVQWKVESRVPCCGSFIIMLEDHTIGNLITASTSTGTGYANKSTNQREYYSVCCFSECNPFSTNGVESHSELF